MRYGWLSLLVPLFLLALAPPALGYQVGVSPGTIDLGNVSPGESRIISFNIFTALSSQVLVSMGAEDGDRSLLEKISAAHGLNYSEESCKSWVEFIENPVEVEPSSASAEANMKGIKFVLNVPEDAEKGYHMVAIKPSPYTAEGLGTGASMVAEVRVNLLFNLVGDTFVKGNVLDATTSRTASKNVRVDTYFQNTGTLTSTVSLSRVALFYENGTLAASAESETARLKPGDVRGFVSMFPGRLPNGGYMADVIFRHHGLEETGNLSIEITGEEPPAYSGAVIGAGGVSWLPLLVTIILTAVIAGSCFLIYRRYSY